MLIHPLRMALSGRTKGPGLFEIADILGQENCLTRIKKAIEFIQSLPPAEL